MPAPPAPLEVDDPDRARALKAKIRDRISDVRRHLSRYAPRWPSSARNSISAFQAARRSEDPVELNCVRAVERGVDQLYNYIAELAHSG